MIFLGLVITAKVWDNKKGEILYFLRPGKISIDGMPCALGLEG